MCCFFFSSRRRHTRCSRDWSSDVCSSDLSPTPDLPASGSLLHRAIHSDPASKKNPKPRIDTDKTRMRKGAHFSATRRGIFRRNRKQAVVREPADAATTNRKSKSTYENNHPNDSNVPAWRSLAPRRKRDGYPLLVLSKRVKVCKFLAIHRCFLCLGPARQPPRSLVNSPCFTR